MSTDDEPTSSELAATRAWALEAGWEAAKISCYDEEGVEGWEWFPPPDSPSSIVSELGPWDEPPAVPEELVELWRAANDERQEQHEAPSG